MKSLVALQKYRLTPPPLWLVIVTIPYLITLALLACFTAIGSEYWWFSCLNLYMPQWVWAIPALLILCLCVVFVRKWSWLPLLLLAWVVGPMMGFCWGIPQSSQVNAPHLRIMTYNVKWGIRDSGLLAKEVHRVNPDVLLLQDSMGVLDTALGTELAGWNVRVSGQYIITSRYPLEDLTSIDISLPGWNHHAVCTRINIAGHIVTLATVHLLSPRNGLVSVRRRNTREIEFNAAARLIETEQLIRFLHTRQGPLILTGDLNAPDQAIVCRRFYQMGLKDAFFQAGFGYGYTYGRFTKVGHSYVRIDHILVSPEWGVSKCFVGTCEASDHCPVVSDVFLRSR